MQYKYTGKNWLKGEKAFVFPGFLDYAQETKARLGKPLAIPEYATAKEAERIEAVSKKVQNNPYYQRDVYAQMAKDMDVLDMRTISYGEYPGLYDVCLFVSREMMGVNPVIYLYTAKSAGMAYNAMALDYLDRVWIYISDRFVKEQGIVRDEELCFLAGHELGHAQCHHVTIASSAKDTSDDEYSADRAGMLACVKWIMKHSPELTVGQAIKKALLYSSSALLKLGIGKANGLNNTDWEKVTEEMVQEHIDGIFAQASKRSLSKGTHPETAHRIMAMDYFSESELIYRCLGMDPGEYPNLATDEQLGKSMAHLLRDN